MAGTSKALLGAKLRLAAYMSSSKVVVPRRAMGAAAAHGHGDHHHHVVQLPKRVDIGKREIVGYGMNGEEVYIDDVHAPFPAIRFKEDTAEIAMLREKEKGDWKKLTLAEKKTLYRASFAQTLVEMEAPTGDWKGIFAGTLFGISLALWGFMWVKKFVLPPLPDTITDEEKVKAQIQRMIDMRADPIEGLTSNYDYYKKEWKWNK